MQNTDLHSQKPSEQDLCFLVLELPAQKGMTSVGRSTVYLTVVTLTFLLCGRESFAGGKPKRPKPPHKLTTSPTALPQLDNGQTKTWRALEVDVPGMLKDARTLTEWLQDDQESLTRSETTPQNTSRLITAPPYKSTQDANRDPIAFVRMTVGIAVAMMLLVPLAWLFVETAMSCRSR